MNNFCEDIAMTLKKSQFDLTDSMIEQFEIYAELLIEWNKKVNLTAILKPKEIAMKHFLDSLLVLEAHKIPQGATVIDVGTGAGFPGVPLKIVRPDVKLTLLDSLNKRLNFLKFLSEFLKIDTNLVHERAEEAAKKETFREKFDVVVSRAVAPLNILLEYSVPFVKANGVFLALKGRNAQIELNNAKNAQSCLNVKIEKVKNFSLIEEEDRNIIVFKKMDKISKVYPRNSSKILKNPL